MPLVQQKHMVKRKLRSDNFGLILLIFIIIIIIIIFSSSGGWGKIKLWLTTFPLQLATLPL